MSVRLNHPRVCGRHAVLHRGSFFFKQKTAYEIRPRDWSSDVCSSDLVPCRKGRVLYGGQDITDVSPIEIGRASCRERGEISGVAGSLKKKTNTSQRSQAYTLRTQSHDRGRSTLVEHV